ncbi:c-type cytochrome [Rhizobium aegyptiacum]|uniref:c-type cytochrome n=1 Tax=Rhizobium aegyptiacum TaxID=1764550 RepID=UPI0007E54A02|nr:c-type cytochrome [Rhizobium aegyptiacum]
MKSAPALLPIFLVVVAGSAFAQEGDAERGRALFQRQCGSCHQVASTRNTAGPTLQGVMGRPAGAVDGYRYSSALKGSGIMWSRETLDTYLANPSAMVQGTRMALRIANEAHRRDIIEFLAASMEK